MVWTYFRREGEILTHIISLAVKPKETYICLPRLSPTYSNVRST